MFYEIPRLDETLRLICVEPEDPAGALEYVLVAGDDETRRLKLSTIAVVLLMMVDGLSSIQTLYKHARADLALAPPPGFIEQLIAALYELGFATRVEVASLPQAALPNTAHVCEGCGRSCEGHLIGPLPPDEARVILDLYEHLAPLHPRYEGERPIVRFSQREGLFLKVLDGRCIFLDEDRRCALHKHYGPMSKPSICRTFPYLRVRAEEGLRLGVDVACFRHHQHHQRALGGPALITLDGELAQLPPMVMESTLTYRHPLTLSRGAPSTTHQGFWKIEAQLIDHLGDPEATARSVCALLLNLDPAALPPAPARAFSPDLVHATRQRLARFLDRIEIDKMFIGFAIEVMPDGLGASLRAALEAAGALGAAPPRQAPLAFDPDARAFTLDSLRRHTWTRQTLAFGSHHRAAAALLMGWVWITDALDVLGCPEAARFDAFGEYATAWYRLLGEDDLHRALLEEAGEAQAIIKEIIEGVG